MYIIVLVLYLFQPGFQESVDPLMSGIVWIQAIRTIPFFYEILLRFNTTLFVKIYYRKGIVPGYLAYYLNISSKSSPIKDSDFIIVPVLLSSVNRDHDNEFRLRKCSQDILISQNIRAYGTIIKQSILPNLRFLLT